MPATKVAFLKRRSKMSWTKFLAVDAERRSNPPLRCAPRLATLDARFYDSLAKRPGRSGLDFSILQILLQLLRPLLNEMVAKRGE